MLGSSDTKNLLIWQLLSMWSSPGLVWCSWSLKPRGLHSTHRVTGNWSRCFHNSPAKTLINRKKVALRMSRTCRSPRLRLLTKTRHHTCLCLSHRTLRHLPRTLVAELAFITCQFLIIANKRAKLSRRIRQTQKTQCPTLTLSTSHLHQPWFILLWPQAGSNWSTRSW